MSVHALTSRWNITLLKDEMESFFHLLVYMSVRFLPSNVRDVPRFIHDYFDAYSDRGDWRACGDRKSTSMIGGMILVDCGLPLQFFWDQASADAMMAAVAAAADPRRTSAASQSATSPPATIIRHPINAILETLLYSIHARYRLRNEDHSLILMRDYGLSWGEGMTPEERARLEDDAALIQDYSRVFGTFVRAMRDVESASPLRWPGNDKVEDRYSRCLSSSEESTGLTETVSLDVGSPGEVRLSHNKRSSPDCDRSDQQQSSKRPHIDTNAPGSEAPRG